MARAAARGRAAEHSVSIAEVARQAGVSVATVSRVLNGKQAVREATRRHVAETIEAMGYRVNHLARNLRTDESRLLLALVPDIGNPFYAQIVQGIDRVVRDRGYSLLLCETGADAGRERRYLDLLHTRRADGAICLDPDTVQQALHGPGMAFPWVACCEFDAGAAVPYVGIDNRAAADEAVTYLLGQGRRRIALINSDPRFMYARLRRQGYADALARAGVKVDPRHCIVVDSLDFPAGRQAAARLMALRQPPDAIFAVSDTLAIGAMRGVREAGRDIPGDVAVMGFDDISLASQTFPALSTMAQPMRELGERAASLLLARLAGDTTGPAGVVLPHRLVLRESA